MQINFQPFVLNGDVSLRFWFEAGATVPGTPSAERRRWLGVLIPTKSDTSPSDRFSFARVLTQDPDAKRNLRAVYFSAQRRAPMLVTGVTMQ
jgi:hypothetical protein